jgi:hypothetical protein
VAKMFFFFFKVRVLPVSRIILNSGKFVILTTFWISLKLHLIDPKFHGDHKYLVYFVDSSIVEAVSLTSGILPENLHKTSK